jgi:hypothetical protein
VLTFVVVWPCTAVALSRRKEKRMVFISIGLGGNKKRGGGRLMLAYS